LSGRLFVDDGGGDANDNDGGGDANDDDDGDDDGDDDENNMKFYLSAFNEGFLSPISDNNSLVMIFFD